MRRVALIVILAAVGIAAAQPNPLSSPKEGVAAKGDSAQAQESAQTQSKQKTAGPTSPIADQAPPISPQADKNQRDEDIKIQGKIANLTAWLVLVGGLQALALIGTLVAVYRQAELMGEHAQHLSGMNESLRDTGKRQLRAYLTVVIGTAIFQERRPQRKGGDLKFECRPNMVNTGQTPAKKIIFRARAAILPQPLPPTLHLPEETNADDGETILGPHQNANMFAVVDGFCADADVQGIKDGAGKQALYVWGLVRYEDVFGDSHYTRFCQHIYWTRTGEARGFYVPGRNDAN